ncbi:helix-turn-helix domain-containing protein [Sphingomonas sp. MMS24-J45]|uniref:helix-turn-helix domain-containing protein n=1 Tax=Sphingomonas sp. MMS24-J45 TaxID=3238806 RepID=UPI0038512D0F
MSENSPEKKTVGGLVSLNDMLEQEGVREIVTLRAFKRVLASKLAQEMQDQHLSKSDMAKRMGTSRAQLDRILDPTTHNVTLETVARAATTLGKRLELDLV